MLFAEYFQIYVQDSRTDETLPVFWESEHEADLCVVTDALIAIRTARELDVPVTVTVADSKPEDEEPLDDWDHAIECSLNVPSGAVMIAATANDLYEAQLIPVKPGATGVRIYWGGLNELDDEGFEGEDHYRISLWPVEKEAERPPFKILKQWTPDRFY